MLRFPARRRRDSGNYRVMLEKALGDALVEGGWLPDDTPEHYEFGGVTFTEGAAQDVSADAALLDGSRQMTTETPSLQPWQRPPFEPGNEVAATHGANSLAKV